MNSTYTCKIFISVYFAQVLPSACLAWCRCYGMLIFLLSCFCMHVAYKYANSAANVVDTPTLSRTKGGRRKEQRSIKE